jgi:preprotein translocase subunit SecF
VLPIIGLLVVGVGLLGVGTLQDLALVQLTGIIAGALSSICLATPLLVDMKMTEPKFKEQAARVAARRKNVAEKAAQREATSVLDDEDDHGPATDDEGLETELRQERAMAAASSVPARNPKPAEARRRPSGKPGRPSGKRRR